LGDIVNFIRFGGSRKFNALISLLPIALITSFSFSNCSNDFVSAKQASVESTEMGSSLTIRPQSLTTADGKVSYLLVKGLAEQKLRALYNGQATLSKVRAMPPDPGASWIIVKEGRWYLFDRSSSGALSAAGTRDFCRHTPKDPGLLQGTTVRVSSDRGQTWTPSIYVAVPTGRKGDPDACQILDGATFFDPDTGIWHLWTQCLGAIGETWKMCHYTSLTPTGVFKRNPNPNAVTGGGSIWKSICVRHPVECGGDVTDEGTPEILFKKDGHFYVSFHGFRHSDGKGFRGVAKTRDFVDFVTAGSDLPGGPTLTDRDCSPWSPGCIGFGAASTLIGEYETYVFSEGPSVSLLCVPGQNWSWGLMKGNLLTTTGKWQQSPMNPIVRGTPGVDCATAYFKMFQDGDDLYAFYTRFESTEQRDRTFDLHKVVQVKAPTPPPPPPSEQIMFINTPLMDYYQPITKITHSNNAWLGATPELGNTYCQFKFGPTAKYVQASSDLAFLQVNICNVSLEIDPQGRLFCSEGKTGSFYRGYVFNKLACRK
jgi:hypothetical protein